MTPALLATIVERQREDALGRQPDHVERADQVDLDDLAEQLERVRPVLADDLGRGADARAIDHDPERLTGRARHIKGCAHCISVDHVGGCEGHR